MWKYLYAFLKFVTCVYEYIHLITDVTVAVILYYYGRTREILAQVVITVPCDGEHF